MGFIDELNQVIYDLPFNKHQASRNEIAHFCEHDGISIHFTRARTTWHALAPCALKPWWLFLEPLRKNIKGKLTENMRNKLIQEENNKKNKITIKAAEDAAKNADLIEVTENA